LWLPVPGGVLMPWWGVALIALAGVVTGGGVVYVWLCWYLSRGLRG
jgi:hypothetical protein